MDLDRYLFKSERSNKPLERVRVWGMLQEWVREAVVEGERYGTHSLRKTWGYQARKQGASIEQISEKLGHRSTIVTTGLLVKVKNIKNIPKSLSNLMRLIIYLMYL